MSDRVPLAILSPRMCHVFRRPLYPLTSALLKLLPTLQLDIDRTDMDTDARSLVDCALINAGFFFLLFSGLLTALFVRVQGKPLEVAAITGVGYSVGIAFVIILIFVRYPGIFAGKKSENIDTYLVFALKELLLQVSSGVSLYAAITNVSRQNYGGVSREFAKVSRDVSAGLPIDKALERLALRNGSPFLGRTVWQLVNALRAGASLQNILRAIIDDATADKKARIRDFASELNLWGLLYMTFAVAVPSIGLTMMIILSTFGNGGIGPSTFILFIGVCTGLQMAIIGFVKTRRPVVSA